MQQRLHATEGRASLQSSYKGECAVAEFITRGSLTRKITQADFKRQGPDFLFFLGGVLHFIYFVCEGAVACIQRPEDKLLESALSLPHVGPRD